MSKVKFYICRHCGNLVEMIHDAGVPVICCGEKMEELKAAGKNKTATYGQHMGNKMMYRNMLDNL